MSLEYKDALNTAYKFLNYRPRTIKEVKNKLQQKGFKEEVISKVIEDLIKKRYLDDVEFSKMWINYRQKIKPMGKLRLKNELIQKGVPVDVAIKVLDNEIDSISEERCAFYLLEKNKEKYLNKPNGLNKLKAFMYRRGFTIETIEKVVKNKRNEW